MVNVLNSGVSGLAGSSPGRGHLVVFSTQVYKWVTVNLMLVGEGCSIHPTRVDTSLVFAIRQTGNRFVNPIPYS